MEALKAIATALTPKNKNAKNATAAPMKQTVNQKAIAQKKNNEMKKLQEKIKLANLEGKAPEEVEVPSPPEEEPTTGSSPAQGVPENSVNAFRLNSESASAEGGGRRKRRHTRKQKRRGRKSRRYRKHY